MALMITTRSTCGRKNVRVDVYDSPNMEGHCCNECGTINACRWAWMDEDGEYISVPMIERFSRTPDNDIFYVR